VEKLALGLGAYFEFEGVISWISKVSSWFNNLKQATFVVEHHDTDGGSNVVFMDLVDIRVLSLYDEGYSQSYNLRGIWRLKQSYALETRKRLLGAERMILDWRNSDFFGRAHQLDSTRRLTRWDDDDDQRVVLKPCIRMCEIGNIKEGVSFTVVVAS
jgi:hypothetical protein